MVVEPRRVGDLADVVERPSAPARGSPRPRRPPARRCRRCSSGSRPATPRNRSARTSVSPSAALRRCPMWAALFGLMAVCSTIVLPAGGAADATSTREPRRQEGRAVEEEVQVAVRGDVHARDAGEGSERRRRSPGRSRAAACGGGAPVRRRAVMARSPIARLGRRGDGGLRERRRLQAVERLDGGRNPGAKQFVDWEDHRRFVSLDV